MGVVWAARDLVLERDIALKTVIDRSDPVAVERLRQEARAAAGISHPNVCHVFDLVEDADTIYLSMELLEGETLEKRLGRGPTGLEEALQIASGILAALAVLHRKGIVHRDLKPGNVFLTPHGLKVTDFGLARLTQSDQRITQTGALVGTPRYMAPEQWNGEPATFASDLFACGAILFECLSGRPAFDGETIAAVCRAVLGCDPPPLSGGAAASAVDRVIRRALLKRPERRFGSAEEMARALSEVEKGVSATQRLEIRALTRLLVAPFRLLRPDPEIDYLSLGLADALTVTLSTYPGLLLRSPRSVKEVESRDLMEVACEAGVDAILTGSLLRGGQRVRLSAQLIEAPRGTVLKTTTAEAPLDDIFALSDTLTRAVAEALSPVLTPREESAAARNQPASSKAYDLYLRAQGLPFSSGAPSVLVSARDLLEACVAEDPGFAPAWARLGRIWRVLGKFGHDDAAKCRAQAQTCFSTALRLDPSLPLTHNLYTYFEIEELGEPLGAVRRLLGRARQGGGDPDLYAGLVVALRFTGLLEASLEAHEKAIRLDPRIQTSVSYTFLFAGNWERAAEEDKDPISSVRATAFAQMGREDEARTILRELDRRRFPGSESHFLTLALAAVDKDRTEPIPDVRPYFKDFNDPEGLAHGAMLAAKAGANLAAMELLTRAVGHGFHVPQWLRSNPWLSELRRLPGFAPLLATAEEGHQKARAVFVECGGEAILGPLPGQERSRGGN